MLLRYVASLQLAGTAALAIGLWLRLDPKTKGLFEGPDSPYVFYTGEILSVIELDYNLLPKVHTEVLDSESSTSPA